MSSNFKFVIVTTILANVLLFGCNGRSNNHTCTDQLSVLPMNIASTDEAFSLMLNSKSRNERYTATLYLQSKLGEKVTKHYSNLLFKVSHPPARLNIYESMGSLKGKGNVSLLAHYLQTADEVDAKAQIICSLGRLGSDAISFVRLIEDMKNAYPRHYSSRKSRGGSIVIRSGYTAWVIRDDSMLPEKFVQIADKAINRISSP